MKGDKMIETRQQEVTSYMPAKDKQAHGDIGFVVGMFHSSDYCWGAASELALEHGPMFLQPRVTDMSLEGLTVLSLQAHLLELPLAESPS